MIALSRAPALAALLALVTISAIACKDELYSGTHAEPTVIRYDRLAYPRPARTPVAQDTGLASRIGGMLKAMEEPAFEGAILPRDAVVIRVLYAPPFDGAAAVRIERTATECVVITVRSSLPVYHFGPPDLTGLQYAIGTDPPALVRKDSAHVDVARCQRLKRLVAAIPFDRAIPDYGPMPDGSEFSIEVATRSRDAAIFRYDFGGLGDVLMPILREAMTLGRVRFERDPL